MAYPISGHEEAGRLPTHVVLKDPSTIKRVSLAALTTISLLAGLFVLFAMITRGSSAPNAAKFPKIHPRFGAPLMIVSLSIYAYSFNSLLKTQPQISKLSEHDKSFFQRVIQAKTALKIYDDLMREAKVNSDDKEALKRLKDTAYPADLIESLARIRLESPIVSRKMYSDIFTLAEKELGDEFNQRFARFNGALSQIQAKFDKED